MNSWEEFKNEIGIDPVSVDHLNRAALKIPQEWTRQIPKSSDIEVTPEYQQIFDWLNAKAPVVFVTGKAGTGKTTLIQFLRENFGGNSVVVAPTGVAALNVHGVTIHSFFRFPPRVVMDDDIKLVRDRSLYRALKLLIIDEISMVRADVIDAIDQFLQLNREISEPFGGVQLLFVGDLFQLPPVLQRREREVLKVMGYQSPYFFSAKALRRCKMVSKELTKVYRQSDEKFISILNQVRVAENSDGILPILNQRQVSPNGEKFITLTATNKVADQINDFNLNKLASPLHTFKGRVSGKFSVEDEKLPSPINLSLKVGAQVMFTKNAESKRWVNGTLGRIVELGAESIRVEISGNDRDGICEVDLARWESYKYEYDERRDRILPVVTGVYEQFPMMLAWAVTIHKSQGKTLDQICLNLGSGAFDYGQVYVALSRCRSLRDIYLAKPIRGTDIKCNPVIRRFYEALNSQ